MAELLGHLLPVKPFGNLVVLFGIPAGMHLPGGCVRGEELADLEKQLASAEDAAFLRSIGVEP